MKTKSWFTLVLTVGMTASAYAQQIPNRFIDYPGFLKDAATVGKERIQRRVTEEQFLQMAKDPATIIYDARSDAKYALLHVKGARHLSLPDVTAPDLAKVFPGKDVRILIYCNNNIENEPIAFTTKVPRASLNIYTFNTLYSYGYTNVYELGPLLDIHKTKIPFEGTLVKPAAAGKRLPGPLSHDAHVASTVTSEAGADLFPVAKYFLTPVEKQK